MENGVPSSYIHDTVCRFTINVRRGSIIYHEKNMSYLNSPFLGLFQSLKSPPDAVLVGYTKKWKTFYHPIRFTRNKVSPLPNQ